MGVRALIVGLVSLWLVADSPLTAQTIHRNGFDGKQPYWVRSESNVTYQVKSHATTTETAHRGTGSEQIILDVEPGKELSNFVRYSYATPQAVVNEETTVSVYVRSTRPGIQLFARLVLPRERDDKAIDEPMTVLLPGDTLKLAKTWQRLDLPRPQKAINEVRNRLRTELKRDVDFSGAYIDRLVLNLYTGAGIIEVQIDDLEISPVTQATVAPPQLRGGSGNPPIPADGSDTPPTISRGATNPGMIPGLAPTDAPRNPNKLTGRSGGSVRFSNGKILVDDRGFFFRAVPYTGGDLKTIKDFGFNALFVDSRTPPAILDEALAHNLFLIPRVPIVGESQAEPRDRLTSNNPLTAEATFTGRNAEAMTTAISRYASNDGILFWDLGNNRTTEQISLVGRTAEAIRSIDINRPRSAEVKDGFRRYSTQVEMISTRRNPFHSNLEVLPYKTYLTQRSRLVGEGTFTWSWVPAKLTDTNGSSPGAGGGGVQPLPESEHIRIGMYTSIASGAKGLGFDADANSLDPRGGRTALLTMGLLNQELTMMEPVLQSIRSGPQWIETSDPNVKAAVLRGERGILVLPIWMGQGTQCVPPQGAIARLSMVVPMVSDGMSAWEIHPARLQCLQERSNEVVGGTKIVIPEFDLTTAIVFTHDLNPDGLVARWQDHSRRVAAQSAEWMIELAGLELEKHKKLHQELEPFAPPLPEAGSLLWQAQNRLEEAKRFQLSKDDRSAYQEAQRAIRPLRILQRVQWETATRSLDLPSASPYALAYRTLKNHWKLQQSLRSALAGSDVLRVGQFEQSTLQGGPAEWTVQAATLDAVQLEAQVVPRKQAPQKPEKETPPAKRDRYEPTSLTRIPVKSQPQKPDLGGQVLRLQVVPKEVPNVPGRTGKVYVPSVLERTTLALTSPVVQLPPGQWVRISAWVNIPEPVKGSAEGLLVYDSIGGELQGLRITQKTEDWQKYHLYRQVPPSGSLNVNIVLTGLGTVYLDDIRVEPFEDFGGGQLGAARQVPPATAPNPLGESPVDISGNPPAGAMAPARMPANPANSPEPLRNDR